MKDERSIFIGGNVKALGNDTYGGYLVRFTGPDRRDLHGEYFSAKTDFCLTDYPLRDAKVLYQHGMDRAIGIRSIGDSVRDEILSDGIHTVFKLNFATRYHKALQALDEPELWKREQEALAEEYEDYLRQWLNAGKMAFSSGALPQSVVVGSDGHIERWAIIDKTNTRTPAEPTLTGIQTLKTFAAWLAVQDNESREGAQNERSGEAEVFTPLKAIALVYPQTVNVSTKGLFKMSPEELQALIQQMVAGLVEQIMARMGGAPAPETAGQIEDALITEATRMVEGEEEETLTAETVRSLVTAQMQGLIEAGIKAYQTAQQQNQQAFDTAFEAAKKNTLTNPPNRSKKARAGGHGEQRDDDGGANRGANRYGGGAPYQHRNIPDPLAMPLVNMIKAAHPTMRYTDEARNFVKAAYKAQNPYVGDLGGFLMPQELRDDILPPLAAQAITFKLGVQQTTVQGTSAVTIPKMKTPPTAYRPGFDEAVTTSEAKFELITAYPRPLAAQVVLPRQLLMGALPSTETKIRDEAIAAIRRKIDKEILFGSGAVESPDTGASIKGILSIVPTAHRVILDDPDGRTPRYDDLVDAETALGEANVESRGTEGFALHPRDRGTFRKMIGTDGHPLFRNNMGEKAYPELIGYPAEVSTQIPKNLTVGTTANCSYIFYGDWSYGEYIMSNDVEVLVDEFTLQDKLMIRITFYTFSDFIGHYPEAWYVLEGVTR